MKKKVLLSTIPGPRELVDGVDLYDIMAARLARGQGVFTPTAHAHCWALYLIAENLRADVTVLENPTWEDFEVEVSKDYDYFGTQLMALYFPETVRMLEIVKSRSPQTITVAGGYGGFYVTDPPEGEYTDLARRIKELTDHFCWDEGVRWFRRLIGDEPEERPIRQRFIPAGSNSVKGLQHLSSFRQPVVLAGLGCPNGCEFCVTSAFYARRKIRVCPAEQLYSEMREQVLRSPDPARTILFVFDEDFFTDVEYVRQVGRLIRSDEELLPYGGVKYFTFGSLRSLSQFSVEELVANGLATVWIGVESTIDEVVTSEHAIAKRACDDVHAYFRSLHEHGVVVTASTVLGWDFHTPANIIADIDAFVSLEPVFYQVTPLVPCPGTELYRRLQEDGRFLPGQDWSFKRYQDDEVMERKHFAQGELRRYYELALEKLFQTNGPSQIGLASASLNGYLKFKDAADPYLRARAMNNAENGKMLRLVLLACQDLAPNEKVGQRARDVEARYQDVFGEMSDDETQIAVHIGDQLRARKARLDGGEGEPVTYPPTRWTVYRGDGKPPVVIRASHDCAGSLLATEQQAASPGAATLRMKQGATGKLAALRRELKELFVERDEFIDGALAAILARQHVLIVGPPGSGKSMLAHAICNRIGGARYFHWLLTKFTTPEELFGPVSLQGLEQDRYYRVTDGKLPTAHIAFLDEIFTANSAILNALLTVINERVYYNDATPSQVPLNTLFGASNALPESRELDCLFDRFLFRYQVDYIENRQGFRRMLAVSDGIRGTASLDLEDLERAQAEAARVTAGEDVVDWLTEIRSRIRACGMAVSDRRFHLSLSGLRAHAYLGGRSRIEGRDLTVLNHMLWTVPEERGSIEEIVTAVVAPEVHAALQLVHQADDVHAKAMQGWFNRDEEEAAITEARVKLLRLSQRLEGIRAAGIVSEFRSRFDQLGSRLAGHLRDVDARQAQLAGTESPGEGAQDCVDAGRNGES